MDCALAPQEKVDRQGCLTGIEAKAAGFLYGFHEWLLCGLHEVVCGNLQQDAVGDTIKETMAIPDYSIAAQGWRRRGADSIRSGPMTYAAEKGMAMIVKKNPVGAVLNCVMHKVTCVTVSVEDEDVKDQGQGCKSRCARNQAGRIDARGEDAAPIEVKLNEQLTEARETVYKAVGHWYSEGLR